MEIAPATHGRGWAYLFRRSFMRSNNPMALADESRKVVEVNGAMARLVGYPPSQIVGRYISDFMASGSLSSDEWREVLRSTEVTGEVELVRANGGMVAVQYAVYPEVIDGRRLVLVVALSVSRWGGRFRRNLDTSPSRHDSRELTKREWEIVRLIALGMTSPEVATELQITAATVNKHVTNAMKKLDARSRAHLVAKALDAGLA